MEPSPVSPMSTCVPFSPSIESQHVIQSMTASPEHPIVDAANTHQWNFSAVNTVEVIPKYDNNVQVQQSPGSEDMHLRADGQQPTKRHCIAVNPTTTTECSGFQVSGEQYEDAVFQGETCKIQNRLCQFQSKWEETLIDALSRLRQDQKRESIGFPAAVNPSIISELQILLQRLNHESRKLQSDAYEAFQAHRHLDGNPNIPPVPVKLVEECGALSERVLERSLVFVTQPPPVVVKDRIIELLEIRLFVKSQTLKIITSDVALEIIRLSPECKVVSPQIREGPRSDPIRNKPLTLVEKDNMGYYNVTFEKLKVLGDRDTKKLGNRNRVLGDDKDVKVQGCRNRVPGDDKDVKATNVQYCFMATVKLLCESPIGCFQTTIQAKSLPFAYRTAEKESCACDASSFWFYAFSDEYDKEPHEVTWSDFSKGLTYWWNRRTRSTVRSLGDYDITYLYGRLFNDHQRPHNITANQTVSRNRVFTKPIPQVRGPVFTFWEWIYSIARLVSQPRPNQKPKNLAELWDKRFIYGFASKAETEVCLKSAPYPCFLLRFPQTYCGTVSVSLIRFSPEPEISHVDPYTQMDLSNHVSLVKAISAMNKIQDIDVIYPDMRKEDLFKYIKTDALTSPRNDSYEIRIKVENVGRMLSQINIQSTGSTQTNASNSHLPSQQLVVVILDSNQVNQQSATGINTTPAAAFLKSTYPVAQCTTSVIGHQQQTTITCGQEHLEQRSLLSPGMEAFVTASEPPVYADHSTSGAVVCQQPAAPHIVQPHGNSNANLNIDERITYSVATLPDGRVCLIVPPEQLHLSAPETRNTNMNSNVTMMTSAPSSAVVSGQQPHFAVPHGRNVSPLRQLGSVSLGTNTGAPVCTTRDAQQCFLSQKNSSTPLQANTGNVGIGQTGATSIISPICATLTPQQQFFIQNDTNMPVSAHMWNTNIRNNAAIHTSPQPSAMTNAQQLNLGVQRDSGAPSLGATWNVTVAQGAVADASMPNRMTINSQLQHFGQTDTGVPMLADMGNANTWQNVQMPTSTSICAMSGERCFDIQTASSMSTQPHMSLFMDDANQVINNHEVDESMDCHEQHPHRPISDLPTLQVDEISSVLGQGISQC